jgi:branched-chain amino acid transport system substrate-binding protein
MSSSAGRRRWLRGTRWTALAAGLIATACGSSGSSQSGSSSAAFQLDTAHPFQIGVVAPLSGPFAAVGQEVVDGMTVAVNDLNAAKGILGRKVELVTRDDAGVTNKAILAAKDLVENQKVDFLFPEAVATQALAVLTYSTPKKLVTITSSGATTAADISKYPYSFQLSTPYTLQGPPTLWGAKQLGATKPGILVTDDATGTQNGDLFQSELGKGMFGLSPGGYEKFNASVTDVTPQLTKLRAAGADAVLTQAAGTAVGAVMRGMRDLGWKAPVIGTNGSVTGDLTKLVPAETASQFHAVVFNITMRTAPDKVDARVQKFVDELSQRGTITNIQVPALHRDIVNLVAWAYDKAGSTDQKKVQAALESLKNATLPDGYLLVYPNPRFSPTQHSTTDADYSKFWALVNVSTRVGGTYQGTLLTVPAS